MGFLAMLHQQIFLPNQYHTLLAISLQLLLEITFMAVPLLYPAAC
jgi:hypothetical protein